MLKSIRFPLLYVTEVLLFLPFVAGFVGLVSFLASVPISQLNLHGKSLPATWEAAVPNHGKYLPGYLLSMHPIVFCCFVALLILSIALLYLVHNAQVAQRREATGSAVLAHKVARMSVLAIWVVVAYILVMYVLVGVTPA